MNPQQPQAPLQPDYSFGQQPGYQQPNAHKKTVLMMIGGGIVLLLLLAWLVFGGKAKPGQADMKNAVQNTGQALAILEEYQPTIAFSGTKNDMALALIVIRGNYQDLFELYNTAYKPKQKFGETPILDAATMETLESAKRANTIDSEIVKELEPKIEAARAALTTVAKNVSTPENKAKVQKAQTDLTAISEILDDQTK